jgi:hypothetical protein
MWLTTTAEALVPDVYDNLVNGDRPQRADPSDYVQDRDRWTVRLRSDGTSRLASPAA